MRFSSRLFLFIFSLLGLVGCTQPDKGEDSKESFYVTSMTSERVQLRTVKSESGWIYPIQVTYTFRACVVDRATQDKIKGHAFKVKEGEVFKESVLSNTDQNGCFSWQEDFPFNYYASRTFFVPFEREIVGSSVYSGSRKVKFAINPWAVGDSGRDKGPNFVFLHDGAKLRDRVQEGKIASVENSYSVLSGEYSRTLSSDGSIDDPTARIWIDQVSLKSVRRRTLGDGILMDLQLSMNPVLKLKDTDGNIITKSIQSGKFDIVAHLVVTDTGVEENKKMILTDPRGVSGVAQIDLGDLTTQMRMKWNKRAHSGNVSLALKVTPKGTNNIGSFEGLFELGGLSSLKGSASAKVVRSCTHPTEGSIDNNRIHTSESPCQSVSQFLKDANNYEELKKQNYASANEPYVFDVLKLRFMSVLSGETATQRVVGYSASTCVTNRFDGSKMADIPFLIEYLDDKNQVIPELSQRKVTNSVGCLIWNSTIHHAYYGPEEFIWHKVRLRTEKSKNNFEKIKEFALNPWDDKFTFGWDKEEFAADFLKAKKVPSRFFLPQFRYHTVRFLYNIDPFMELEVKKTVLLEIEPRVLRYAGIVNARKQTEPLRDGIYLLKVGIQKDFLDPTERSVDLDMGERKSPSHNDQPVPSVILKSLGPVTPREYITTDMSLVRVVDGHLIHPIELTMRDLRLMRVRSNMLIQLETVDERKIQAHDVFNRMLKEDLAALRNKRETEEKARQALMKENGEDFKSSEDLLTEKEKESYLYQSKEIREKYKNAFFSIRKQLEEQPFINNSFELDEDLLRPIRSVLEANDFTKLSLPNKEEADLNLFREDKPDLKRRTFVGPVIFLSNAYSDSMRATDNLDEANCSEIERVGQKRFIEGEKRDKELDALEEDRSLLMENEGINGDPSLASQRQNKAYRFSRYYGALTHLCYAQVDDLLEREAEYEDHYKKVMPLASSKANMARSAGLDYVSLTNEPLQKLPQDECEKNFLCKNLRSRELTSDYVEKLLRYALDERAQFLIGGASVNSGIVEDLKKTNLVSQLHPPLDYRKVETNGNPLAFKLGVTGDVDTLLSCSILSDLATDRLLILAKDRVGHEVLGKLSPSYVEKNRERIARQFSALCMREQSYGGNAVIVDEKLKVLKTGPDYVFRGGLQMNFNVGTNVSFGNSSSWSGSAKLDDVPSALKSAFVAGGAMYGAFIGPMGAVAGGVAGLIAGAAVDLGLAAIKPIGISKGRGMSNSDGNSVSKGTYLVSQMAKFDVPLESFQRCRILKFSEDFSTDMIDTLGLHKGALPFISKGFMSCGKTVKGLNGSSALRVPETYFYFTQHFTEGDMLDQADLYNHPWLLAMRGLRDFGTFVTNIEAVETTSLAGFWNGLWEPKKKDLDWPLGHMAVTYRQQTPTFPGFYTLSEYEDAVTTFPLNDRFQMMETDINGEVNCSIQKTNGRFQTCSEKLAIKPDGTTL